MFRRLCQVERKTSLFIARRVLEVHEGRWSVDSSLVLVLVYGLLEYLFHILYSLLRSMSLSFTRDVGDFTASCLLDGVDAI